MKTAFLILKKTAGSVDSRVSFDRQLALPPHLSNLRIHPGPRYPSRLWTGLIRICRASEPYLNVQLDPKLIRFVLNRNCLFTVTIPFKRRVNQME
jgi:hypothetical protein